MCNCENKKTEKKEELLALLKHMAHHTEHHTEDLAKYMNDAKELGLSETAEELEKSIALSNQLIDALSKACSFMEE